MRGNLRTRIRAGIAATALGLALLGTGMPSASAAAPAQPTAVSASGADGSVRVSWTAPADNGGKDITGYTASAYAASTGGTAVSACTPASAASTNCVIGELTNGTTYYVSVTATNADGTGNPSSPRVEVVAGTVPGAPTGVTVSRSTTGMTVTWTAPSSTGGSAITSYTASARTSSSTSAPAVASCTTSGTSCDISGLASTVTYYVSVKATNAVGTGAASTTVTSGPTGPPTAPRNVTVTRGNGFALVKWSAPESTGGSRVTRYLVEAFTVATGGDRVASCEPATLTSMQCNVGPLPNGTTYYVQVTAFTVIAPGEASTPRVSIIPAAPPEVPRSVTAQRVGPNVEVSWQVPTSDGGLPIEAYVASAYAAPTGGSELASCTTAGPTCQITGLRGAAVYVDVVARTPAGRSPASTPRARVRVIDPVDVPTAVAGSARNEGIVVTWRPPLDDGGTPVSAYQASAYEAPTGGTAVSSCDRGAADEAARAGSGTRVGCTIAGLAHGRIYYLEVAATSEAGTTITPERTAVRVRPGLPLLPRAVSGFGARDRIGVVWELPASDGGEPVLEYRVRGFAKESGTDLVSSCTAPGDAAATTFTCTLTGTPDFEPTWVEITARNARGWGQPTSRLWLESKPSVPSAPQRVQLRPRDQALSVVWERPHFDGGYPVYSYVATAYGAASSGTALGECRVDVPPATSATATTPTRCTIPGLAEDSYVYVEVTAENTVGIGAPSSRAGEAVIPGPPAQSSAVVATRGKPGVQVSWTAPEASSSLPVTGYRVRAYASLTSDAVLGTCTSSGATTCTITGEAAAKAEYVEVAAQNTLGWGDPSARVAIAEPKRG